MNDFLQRVRAFERRHPLWWNVIPAIAVAAISARVTPNVGPTGLALLLVVMGAVAFRRRSPIPALAIALAAVLAAGAIELVAGTDPPWMYLAVWLLLFNVGLRERNRLLVVGCFIAVTATTALASRTHDGTLETADRVSSALAVLGMCAASFLLGLQIRSRREQVAAQQAEIARAAVVTERSRIAQEMHDIIGHNLSVITSLANGGANAVRRSPRDAALAFDAIGEVSRSSVQEVRRILTVLRHDYSAGGSSLSPQPGLDDIPSLVDSVRSAGLEVRLERTGELRDLSAGRQLAVYRIVQESLTNSLRHAGARARVHVRIGYDCDEIVVAIHDNGSPVGKADGERGEGSGHGIIGMRERAEAYGGTLQAAGTLAGWRVLARIPRATGGGSLTGPGSSER